MRRHLWTALSIVLLSATSFGPVQAQLSKAEISELQAQAEIEGWTFEVGENPATRYSLEELCGLKEPPNWRDSARFDPMTSIAAASLPSAFDWRTVSGCPPIRNQGGCGSCWAFATVGALECAIRIREGIDVDLSEQWLLSCNSAGWDCGGGWFAHGYHQSHTDPCGGTGAVLEADCPYQAARTPCACPYPHHYVIESWAYIGQEHSVAGVEQIKQAILQHGPVSVAIYVNSAFQAYRSGIFNACTTGDINHAVVLVGWDDAQGENGVWILRNSWGRWWGEDGYMRIPYGSCQVGNGACYVSYRPVNISSSVELGPAPLAADFAFDVPWSEVTACVWDFGDGTGSSELTPSHQYLNPGLYDVSVDVTTPEGEFRGLAPGLISAYADTIRAGTVQIDPANDVVRVDVTARNNLPLKTLRIPFSWAGALHLDFDSFSVAGTRAQHFEESVTRSYDPARFRATVELSAGTAAPLASGSGSVVSLYFNMPTSVSGANPISFITYAAYSPEFVAFAGAYPPALVDGLVYRGVSIGCCEGVVGDVNQVGGDEPTIGDVSELIAHLFIDPRPFACTEEADVNQSGGSYPAFSDVTIGDVSALIDYLFVIGDPLPPCP